MKNKSLVLSGLLCLVVLFLSGCEVTIPDLVEMHETDAGAALENVGLSAGTVSYAEHEEIPQDHIISHVPEAGTKVKKGSSVDLLVSSGKAVLPTIPDLVGQGSLEAQAALVTAGFAVGDVTEECNDSVAAGAIISMVPPPDTQAESGTVVALTVSSGPCPLEAIPVPDLAGMNGIEAEAAITAANLTMGDVTEECSDTVDEGKVIRQEPAAIAMVMPGSAVSFVLSTGSCPPDYVTVPDVNGQSSSAAEAAVVGAGLAFGAVTQECSNTVPSGNVIRQNPAAGAQVEPGSEVSVVLSSGPCPPDTVVVPSVTGQTQSAASSAITAAGLTVGITEQCSDSVAAGRVISQNPAAGTNVNPGTQVSIVVSTGACTPPPPPPPPTTVTVPNVVGMPEVNARATIIGANLTVGTVTQEYSETVPLGQVISQNPLAFAQVPPKTAVGIVVSKGLQPDPFTINKKPVNVNPDLIADTGLPTDQFVIESFLSQANAGAKNVAVEFADVDKGQVALVIDTASGNTILAVYVTPQEIAAGAFTITAESVAKALVLFNPYVMILTHDDRENLLSMVSTHSLYEDLIAAIQDALTGEYQNLLDVNVYPGIWEFAMTIGVELLQWAPDKAPAFDETKSLGAENAFHLDDPAGPDIQFVNPKMIFYGVDVSPGDASALVAGKDSLFSIEWGWPPVVFTSPVVQNYSLGDGIFSIIAYKGFNFDEPNWLDITTGPGKATYANLIKTISIIVDVLLWCPLDNGDIKLVLDGITDSSLVGWNEIMEEGLNDWPNVVVGLVDLAGKNWEKISYWIWQEWPGEGAVFLHRAGSLIGDAAFVLKAISAANEKLPFFWDLIFADAKVEYPVIQTDGFLSLYQPALIPPTAKITFPEIEEGAPIEVLVNAPLTVDASHSFDNQDGADLLSVRWDFNNDGIFDTGWSTAKTQTVAYSNVGIYTIVLEVRDLDGLIGRDAQFVYVKSDSAQGTAVHICVFRDNLPWDSYAFEHMMAALNYTEGMGELQYSFHSSFEMSSIILRPGIDLVLVTNDQNQTFYNNLAAAMDRFLRFLDNGGTILWGACDAGWADGSMQYAGITLPGGVIPSLYYDPTNYVVLPGTSLMSGVPMTLSGNYASHEGFANLPVGTTVYTIDTRNMPTLIEYSQGRGRLIITGQPLEWGYDRLGSYTIGLIYPNLINYVFGVLDTKALHEVVVKAGQQSSNEDMPSVLLP